MKLNSSNIILGITFAALAVIAVYAVYIDGKHEENAAEVEATRSYMTGVTIALYDGCLRVQDQSEWDSCGEWRGMALDTYPDELKDCYDPDMESDARVDWLMTCLNVRYDITP